MATTKSSGTGNAAKTTELSIGPAKVTIDQQTGSSSTYYGTWSWSKSETAEYEVKWSYYTGDNVRFGGDIQTVKNRNSTYSPPENARSISLEVRAIGKNNSNGKPKWRSKWSARKTYYLRKHNKPLEPGSPDINIEKDSLTVSLNIDPIATYTTSVEFHIYQDDKFLKASPKLPIKNKFVSWTTNVETAGHQYKCRVFAYNDDQENTIGDYTGNVDTIPSNVSSITSLVALTKTSVKVTYPAATGAKSYTIEYSTNKENFDSGGEVGSVSSNTTFAICEGLNSGSEYFFRVKASNSTGDSEWSPISSIKIGSKPAPPTTWSSTTTGIIGEPLTLHWVHNTEDNSREESAIIEMIKNGVSQEITVPNTTPADESIKTNIYSINSSTFSDGDKINWRVKTKGIMPEYSDWSVMRTIDMFQKPTIGVHMTDVGGNGLNKVTSYPITIHGNPSPNTQTPLSYYLNITAKNGYTTTDDYGFTRTILAGEQVFGKFLDTNEKFKMTLSAGDVDLENNQEYIISCTVAMNSGLSAEDSIHISVEYGESNKYEPELGVEIKLNDMSAILLPSCRHHPIEYYNVEYKKGRYILGDKLLTEPDNGIQLFDKSTVEGYPVYKYVEAGATKYYTDVPDEVGILQTGVKLAVYRRNSDGTFILLASDVENTGNTYITDPHPTLDAARYRVVATDKATGQVTFSDIIADVGNDGSVILQWEEEWYPLNSETQIDDIFDNNVIRTSLLKLRGNVDVSDTFEVDNALIEYIGRENPVGYYGTHVRTNSTWSVDIPKDDIDTLYAIRRLSRWKGNCYVREPSGSGYWAKVTPSYSITHKEVIIPVTFDIKRVEGGI